jgi:hypothetical protein
VVQAVQFMGFRDAGQKAILGRDGWLFYQPGVSFLTQRPQPRDSTPSEAVEAVVRFRDDLAARGIQLIVMPAPNKESVYPDQLARWASPPVDVIGEETRTFLTRCEAADVEVVDLFALYRAARQSVATPLYLQQDSHWSPAGMEMAATAVARRILSRHWLEPGSLGLARRPRNVQQIGDLVRMLRSPDLEARVGPESIACAQVIRRDTGKPFSDDPAAEVLALGDSFLRIYEHDEPGSAGFVAHLALALGRPVAGIINDGGASTLVRQELYRRPRLLARARVVVWEFVERDIRLGTEGWHFVPLPSSSTTPGPKQHSQ